MHFKETNPGNFLGSIESGCKCYIEYGSDKTYVKSKVTVNKNILISEDSGYEIETDKKVWELIKDSVPLDKSFGDACISEKHCNFFVNKGNAKFEDMKKLIDFVSESVFEKTGIKLETEIKILE